MVAKKQSIGEYSWDENDFLGEGSFGKVYKGFNKKGEAIAVKCMAMENFQDKYMLETLENEINVMKELESVNIVKLYEV